MQPMSSQNDVTQRRDGQHLGDIVVSMSCDIDQP